MAADTFILWVTGCSAVLFGAVSVGAARNQSPIYATAFTVMGIFNAFLFVAAIVGFLK